MTIREPQDLEALQKRLQTLEFQVVKLDRLVYKLFKRLKQETYPQYQ